nr:MAG TPA: hypothetical protein [Caudoviricetes sp.]
MTSLSALEAQEEQAQLLQPLLALTEGAPPLSVQKQPEAKQAKTRAPKAVTAVLEVLAVEVVEILLPAPRKVLEVLAVQTVQTEKAWKIKQAAPAKGLLRESLECPLENCIPAVEVAAGHMLTLLGAARAALVVPVEVVLALTQAPPT